VIDIQAILDIVHTSTAERLASKFVTSKTKNLVIQVLKAGYEEECTRFYQHVEGLYA
jgi:hypothetical protein